MRFTYAPVLAVAAITMVAPAAHAAADTDAAANLVKGSVDAALKVLKDPKLQGRSNRPERWAELRRVSDEAFDWSTMSQRSLGIYWRKLDQGQRKRFVLTFRELLASHYLGQIDRFSGKEKLEFKGTGTTPEGVEVKMLLVTASREKVPLHFFVDERPKVYDVSIEGVSIANHYRGVFNRQLTNGDFEKLMKKLERKIARKKERIEQGDAKAASK